MLDGQGLATVAKRKERPNFDSNKETNITSNFFEGLIRITNF